MSNKKSVSKFDGAYWKKLEMESGNGLLNYEVSMVSANNNVPSAKNYDEEVPFTTGTQFHVWNMTHKQKVWFSFGTQVESYLEDCKIALKMSNNIQVN